MSRKESGDKDSIPDELLKSLKNLKNDFQKGKETPYGKNVAILYYPRLPTENVAESDALNVLKNISTILTTLPPDDNTYIGREFPNTAYLTVANTRMTYIHPSTCDSLPDGARTHAETAVIPLEHLSFLFNNRVFVPTLEIICYKNLYTERDEDPTSQRNTQRLLPGNDVLQLPNSKNFFQKLIPRGLKDSSKELVLQNNFPKEFSDPISRLGLIIYIHKKEDLLLAVENLAGNGLLNSKGQIDLSILGNGKIQTGKSTLQELLRIVNQNLGNAPKRL